MYLPNPAAACEREKRNAPLPDGPSVPPKSTQETRHPHASRHVLEARAYQLLPPSAGEEVIEGHRVLH